MFYNKVKGVAKCLAHLMYRYDVSGLENIPTDGPFLLCGNHIHWLDPIVVAVFPQRQLRFIAKKELFKNRIFGAFLKKMGAFPIDRSTTDMQAFRNTMNALKEGYGVLIFSQGTRMEAFENAKSGVALFALKSGAPIVPVGIKGTYRFRSKVQIKVGKPMSMAQYQGQKFKTEDVNQVMSDLSTHINALLK